MNSEEDSVQGLIECCLQHFINLHVISLDSRDLRKNGSGRVSPPGGVRVPSSGFRRPIYKGHMGDALALRVRRAWKSAKSPGKLTNK